MTKKHVPGKNKGDVMVYALSTCIWCRKVKELLNSLGVDYYYTDVDTVEETAEKERIKQEINKWNSSGSFPTIVVNNKECIVGFDESKIKETLG
jgi:glutaredoxin